MLLLTVTHRHGLIGAHEVVGVLRRPGNVVEILHASHQHRHAGKVQVLVHLRLPFREGEDRHGVVGVGRKGERRGDRAAGRIHRAEAQVIGPVGHKPRDVERVKIAGRRLRRFVAVGGGLAPFHFGRGAHGGVEVDAERPGGEARVAHALDLVALGPRLDEFRRDRGVVQQQLESRMERRGLRLVEIAVVGIVLRDVDQAVPVVGNPERVVGRHGVGLGEVRQLAVDQSFSRPTLGSLLEGRSSTGRNAIHRGAWA